MTRVQGFQIEAGIGHDYVDVVRRSKQVLDFRGVTRGLEVESEKVVRL